MDAFVGTGQPAAGLGIGAESLAPCSPLCFEGKNSLLLCPWCLCWTVLFHQAGTASNVLEIHQLAEILSKLQPDLSLPVAAFHLSYSLVADGMTNDHE